jgi:acetyl esterase
VVATGELKDWEKVSMNKEQFARALARAKPLPLDNIGLARKILVSKVAKTKKVRFVGQIDDIEIETSFGRSKVRIYTPEGRGPFPVILYMHGGGFCVGDLNLCDNTCRLIATAAEAVLVSVDYRLAPEHKFPCALEECYRIAVWLLQNDTYLNIYNDRLVFAGDSAGGNLAAALSLLARERQEFSPAYQLLICPLLDQQTDHAAKIKNVALGSLSSERSHMFRHYYFRAEDDGSDPLLSPLLANDFSGLPATTLVTAELDPLTAEAQAYAQRLLSAGIKVKQHHYLGHVHDFVLYVGPLPEAAEAASLVGRDIAEHFSTF